MTVKIRYKEPEADESTLVQHPVAGVPRALGDTSDDFRFSAAVAAFGMLLRQSDHRGSVTYRDVRRLARGAMGSGKDSARKEFVELVGRAADLAGRG